MSIVIFSSHPDDEILITGGIIKNAIDNKINVIVVTVTNGDISGKESGKLRMTESVNAISLLGVNPDNHFFLSYGDATLRQLYYAQYDTSLVPSNAGTSTYGIPNYEDDFHSYLYGESGSYNRKTISSDIQAILRLYRPDHIYTTSLYDSHSDHSSLYLFVVDAIIKMKRKYHNYSPILHESIVHAPQQNNIWPSRETDPSPLLKFSMPPGIENTPLNWESIEDIPVPSSMQVVPRTNNLKYNAIQKYQSQLSSFLKSFVKSNEFFWKRDFSNIACLATVTVSSENTNTKQLGTSAIDGIIGGYPLATSKEWVTKGQLSGAWIRLDWERTYLVNSIILYDRPNKIEQIQEATLTFSDGSSIKVTDLPNNGSGYPITFTPKLISWVKLTIDKAVGSNIGLSEFEVYQSNIASIANVTVSSENKVDGQLGVAAIDGRVDGYPGDSTREWVTNGELDGAWIKLSWDKEYVVDHVVLYDRLGGYDHIEKGTLSFSDGSSVTVQALRTDGKGDVIVFPSKTISWVQFTVTQATGTNVGLCEFEVHSAN